MKSNKDYTDILVEGIAIADPQLAQQYANAQKQLNDKDAQIIALQKQINNLETQKMQLQKAMIAIEQKASQAIPKTPVTTPASTPQTNQTTQPAQTTTQNQPQTTTESFHDILKITPINEELFDITNAEDDELESLKNFMDSENIEYYEDPEEETIEFDKDMLDYEWKNSLEDIGLVELNGFGDEIRDIAEPEEAEEIELTSEEHEKIDEDKVFYVKIEDEGDAFIGKIYKNKDDDEWLSKITVGESDTFDKLYYEPSWDEVDIIAFLRDNYADATLISKDEYNAHVKNNDDNIIEEGEKHKIKKLDVYLSETSQRTY